MSGCEQLDCARWNLNGGGCGSSVLVGEKIQSGLDRVAAAWALAWALVAAFLESAVDLLTGREVPHPDLKQVAPSPEPIRQVKQDRAA